MCSRKNSHSPLCLLLAMFSQFPLDLRIFPESIIPSLLAFQARLDLPKLRDFREMMGCMAQPPQLRKPPAEAAYFANEGSKKGEP